MSVGALSLPTRARHLFVAVHESACGTSRFRCGANVWTLLEVKRTGREGRHRADLTKMTDAVEKVLVSACEP